MRLIINIDGASRGNPGRASVGVVLRDAEGKTLKEHGRCIGRETNNVAEYTAMIDALRLAAGMGARELVVRSDSQLLVRQLTGRYRVKNPGLKPLFAEIQKLKRGFKAVSFEHVPRERNKRADALANEALDGEGRTSGGSEPPEDGPAQLALFREGS